MGRTRAPARRATLGRGERVERGGGGGTAEENLEDRGMAMELIRNGKMEIAPAIHDGGTKHWDAARLKTKTKREICVR